MSVRPIVAAECAPTASESAAVEDSAESSEGDFLLFYSLSECQQRTPFPFDFTLAVFKYYYSNHTEMEEFLAEIRQEEALKAAQLKQEIKDEQLRAAEEKKRPKKKSNKKKKKAKKSG